MLPDMNLQQIPADPRELPYTVDIPTAGHYLGIGRDVSYRLAREGRFPLPVLRVGRRLRITRASLLTALDVADPAVQQVPS